MTTQLLASLSTKSLLAKSYYCKETEQIGTALEKHSSIIGPQPGFEMKYSVNKEPVIASKLYGDLVFHHDRAGAKSFDIQCSPVRIAELPKVQIKITMQNEVRGFGGDIPSVYCPCIFNSPTTPSLRQGRTSRFLRR